ncbi:MAG: hypothetical protein IMW89_04595 [Ktedonobacteraceae bacterium]|nr:hypothetical protein [Ktedonobacteraceae bacterium]
MYLSPEARLAAQEELTTLLHAHIKQMSIDMRSNFEKLDQSMQLGFTQAHTYIEEHMATKEDAQSLEQRVQGVERHLQSMEQRIQSVERHVQGMEQRIKDEMSAMEKRIITAVRDLLQQ